MLDGIKAQLGVVPNLMRTFAQSPAAQEFFLAGSRARAGGALPARLREQLDLTVSGVNGCGYCLAAHTCLGKKHGLTDAQVADARRWTVAADPKADTLVQFAQSLALNRGRVSDGEVTNVRTAGATDAELAHVVAAIGL